MLRMLDLFSGIGGFSLGAEATGGFETISFCEIDPFCRQVLKKHWPNVPIFEDITKLGEGELNGLGNIDVICGGFPCQDISCAGKGAGIHAARSGLWWEMLRIIRLVRPRYVLVENVAALLNRGLDEVLGSLAESGYDAEWTCLRASDFGAPHRRERIFLMAYPKSMRLQNGIKESSILDRSMGEGTQRIARSSDEKTILANTESGNGYNVRRIWSQSNAKGNRAGTWTWEPEPQLGRMADGISHRVDRLRALGNAIVPQCAQYIAECVLEYDARMKQ